MSAEYNSICDWLNGHTHGSMKDFEQAMAIIDSYMSDKAQRMRTLRSDAKIWELFETRLQELDRESSMKRASLDYHIMAEVEEIINKPQVEKTAEIKIPISEITNKSGLIKALEDENRLILKNQGHLHAQLSAIGRSPLGKALHLSASDKNKRKDLRGQIVGYEEKLRKNWHAIKHVQIYGQLPEEPKPKEKNGPVEELPDKWTIELNRKNMVYLQTQIEKDKKLLPGLSGEELLKVHNRLSKRQANLDARTINHDKWQAHKKSS